MGSDKPAPLQDGIDRIGQGGQGFELGAGSVGGQAAVKADGYVDVGKPGGWTIGGTVQYVKGLGAAAWGRVRWTK